MKTNLISALLAIGLGLDAGLIAADPIFSGPVKGEKTTPFKVVDVSGAQAGREREVAAVDAGKPLALVFVHGIERSLVPLLRVLDEYGALRKDTLTTEIVFLALDRIEGEQRVKAAAGSLKLQSPVGLSVDGIEGPGNYGLNKECLMTIIIGKGSTVTANFALVQPGIADAPKVLAALANVCGDESPPSVAQLSERQMARTGARRDAEAVRRDGAGMARERAPLDLAKLDLDSEAGLRDAVKALSAEVRSLRAEVTALRSGGAQPGAEQPADKPREPFPGAVPADGRLQGLLRSFIRPTNDDATVDKLLAEVKAHIGDNADLRRQALDGWMRILHFGDRYGTEYSRKVGREFLRH